MAAPRVEKGRVALLLLGVMPGEVYVLPIVLGGGQALEEEVAEVVLGDDPGAAGGIHRHRVVTREGLVTCGRRGRDEGASLGQVREGIARAAQAQEMALEKDPSLPTAFCPSLPTAPAHVLQCSP